MTTAAPTLPTLMARPWVVTLAGMLLPWWARCPGGPHTPAHCRAGAQPGRTRSGHLGQPLDADRTAVAAPGLPAAPVAAGALVAAAGTAVRSRTRNRAR